MKVIEVRHPLVRHKLGLLRRADLGTRDFRDVVGEIATLLAYEATADLPTEHVEVEGWAGPVMVERIEGRKITLVPVLRAGLGLLPGVLEVVPAAKVSVVGLQRDEATLDAVGYYARLVDGMADRVALVLDPMLATGGTLAAAIDFLVQRGADHITAICLLSAPEGVERVEQELGGLEVPVTLVTAAMDERLNEKGYIVPGLGDAGDRLYGLAH